MYEFDLKDDSFNKVRKMPLQRLKKNVKSNFKRWVDSNSNTKKSTVMFVIGYIAQCWKVML